MPAHPYELNPWILCQRSATYISAHIEAPSCFRSTLYGLPSNDQDQPESSRRSRSRTLTSVRGSLKLPVANVSILHTLMYTGWELQVFATLLLGEYRRFLIISMGPQSSRKSVIPR